MGIFKKTTTSKSPKHIARVAKMSTYDLHMWGDTVLMQLGASFDKHRLTSGPAEDVDAYLDAFTAIWEEMKRREHDRPAR